MERFWYFEWLDNFEGKFDGWYFGFEYGGRTVHFSYLFFEEDEKFED